MVIRKGCYSNRCYGDMSGCYGDVMGLLLRLGGCAICW